MVKFELERHLPIPADDAAFDFVLLPKADPEAEPTEGKRVLIAAADRRLIDSALRLAEEAKLRPVSITVAAHDLLALVEVDPRQRVAWLHRTGDATELLLAPRLDARVQPQLRRRRRCDPARGDPPEPRRRALARLRRGLGLGRRRRAARCSTSVSRSPIRPGRRGRSAAWLSSPSRAAPPSSRSRTASNRRIRPLDLIPAGDQTAPIHPSRMMPTGAARGHLAARAGALLVPGFRESRRLARVNGEIARIDPEVRAVERAARELERKRQLVSTLDKISAGLAPAPRPAARADRRRCRTTRGSPTSPSTPRASS